MPNRSIRDEMQDTDTDGNQTGARRTVAPPTQSAFGPASASSPPPVSPTTKTDTSGNVQTADPATSDLSVQGAYNKLKNRGAQIDKAVDDDT